MRFGDPGAFLYLLVLVPLFLLYLVSWRMRKKARARLGDGNVLDDYVITCLPEKRFFKGLIAAAALILMTFSLARPQWGREMEEVKSEGVDIVFTLDTSLSMNAEDVKPSRLERAKIEIADFIDRLRGNQVGLVSFAGSAYVQCPLTLDYSAAKMFLDVIDTNIIPEPGTALGEAIRTAAAAFEPVEDASKVLILVTDGEFHEGDPLEAAEEAKEKGIIIHTVGVGSLSGEPIPIRNSKGELEGYKRDEKGEPVMTRLDEKTLVEIAETTGGIYTRSERSVELDRISEKIGEMERRKFESRMRVSYKDRFQWFLAAALAMMLLYGIVSERKFR